MRQVIPLAFVAIALAAAYAYYSDRLRVPPARVPASVAVAAPGASAGPNPKPTSAGMLRAMKGVQQYCVDGFHLDSCLVYVSQCRESCVGLMSPQAQVRFLTALNAEQVKRGGKPMRFSVSGSQSNVIGR